MNHSDIEHMAQGFPPSSIGKDHEEVVTFLATSLLAAQQKLEQAEGDAQVGLQLSERLARQLDEAKLKLAQAEEDLESEKRKSAMYKKMRGIAVAGHAQDLDRIDAVAEELGKLAGAILNRTLDSGSKQAVAYADWADMAAEFAAQLRSQEAK